MYAVKKLRTRKSLQDLCPEYRARMKRLYSRAHEEQDRLDEFVQTNNNVSFVNPSCTNDSSPGPVFHQQDSSSSNLSSHSD